MNDIFVDIGVRLKEERRKTGLDQAQFGRLAGASGQTQMRYETGKQLPKIEYLAALAGHDVDSGYILTGMRNDGSWLANQYEWDMVGSLRHLDEDARKILLDLVRHFAEKAIGEKLEHQGDNTGNTLHSPTRTFRGKEPEK